MANKCQRKCSNLRIEYWYMAKCATCIFHEKDKCMENAWFLANYNEANTMRFPCVYPNARKTHVAHLAMYNLIVDAKKTMIDRK